MRRQLAWLVPLAVAGTVAHNAVQVLRLRTDSAEHDHALVHDAVVGDTGVGDGAAPPLRLVVLGDSYPAGFSLTHPAQAYPQQLATRLARHTGRPVQVTCRAVRGARTVDVTGQQVPGIEEVPPDVVAVIVGANDVLGARTPRQVGDDTAALLAAVANRAPHAQVVLGRTANLGDAPALPWPLRELIGLACDRAARAQAEVADAVGVPHGRLPRQGPEMFGPDGFHGSAASHAQAADLTLEVLAGRLTRA